MTDTEATDPRESRPNSQLLTMLAIFEGGIDAGTPGLSWLQKRLVDFAKEDWSKFCLMMERLQLSHNKKVEAINARIAAERGHGGSVGAEVDASHVRSRELIAELLARATGQDHLSLTRSPEGKPV